jgi:hypothetical protein
VLRAKDIAEATKITHDRVTAFAENRVELLPEEKRDLFDFITGRFGIKADGKIVRRADAALPTVLHSTSATLPEDMIRRRAALERLKTLPLEDLEKLAARVELSTDTKRAVKVA